MQAQFFDFRQTKLYYTKTGKGKLNMLFFHGFGQDHQAFKKIEEHLLDHYTLYSFDIFFHGRSEWNKGEQPLEKLFWKELVAEFLLLQHIDNFSVLGFSMGGKFALATLEAFPEKVKQVFLIAPDGIKTKLWYSLATYASAFRKLFKSMINQPQRFKAIEKFAVSMGLVDKGIVRFIESQMDTPEKRSQVYHAWVVFRHLKFNMNVIANLINSRHIETHVIIGKYDKVITVKDMNRLITKLDDYQFEILETGHNGVIQESIKVLGKFSS